ncbi:hypothetical protein RJ55_06243 [Drechmeria coniospora]|nr:hypothetical protein RJ55_06243 [Drechmeria coniospora]
MATVAPESLVPEATLRRLAPRNQQGFWLVLAQHEKKMTLAYVMDGGLHSLTYHINTCNTENDVKEICGNLLYAYDGNQGPESSVSCIGVPNGSQPVRLVLRSREPTAHDGFGVHSQVQDTFNMNCDQEQVGMDQHHDLNFQHHGLSIDLQNAPHDAVDQMIQPATMGQGHEAFINNDGESSLDWEITVGIADDIFSGIDPLMEDHHTPYTNLSGGNAILGPILNEYPAGSGDVSLPNSETEVQVDWDPFQNN